MLVPEQRAATKALLGHLAAGWPALAAISFIGQGLLIQRHRATPGAPPPALKAVIERLPVAASRRNPPALGGGQLSGLGDKHTTGQPGYRDNFPN